MTIQELRAKIGTELGYGGWFSSFGGTAAEYEALSADEKITLTNAMREYIRANPTEFTSTQVTVASSGGGVDIPLTDSYTVGDAASDFLTAAADEAVSINESVNPFSATNRKWVLAAVVAGAAIYFLAPRALELWKAYKAK